MTRFARRLVGYVGALTFVPIASVAVAAPGVSSPQCDPAVTNQCVSSSAQCDKNWARNVWTNECKPPPPIPDWYVPKPPWAPQFAPADIPPPPPPPWWAQLPGMQLRPVWDGGKGQWDWIGI